MTTEPTVPEAMLEAAAKALHGHDRLDGEPDWDELQEWDRQSYKAAVAAVLAAALSVCEVREQYGWIHGEPGTDERREAWLGDRAKAEGEEHYWKGHKSADFRLARRLRIVTPADDVPGGER